MSQQKTFKPAANVIGDLCKGKDGKLYIKVVQDITLKTGQYINLQSPTEKLDWLVANGKITEEQREERESKIPDFVKYHVTAGK